MRSTQIPLFTPETEWVMPEELKDLPTLFGAEALKYDLSKYEVHIFAEITDAPNMSVEEIIHRSNYFRENGADVIDIGCLPNQSFPHLSETIKELKRQGFDLILYNPRKPPITNLKSFNIVKNSKCKIFNTYDIEKSLHTEIQIHQENIKETIELLFSETDHFENLFKSFDSQFWKSIEVSLKKICITKFHDSIKNILVLTNFFSNYDISSINTRCT